MKKPLLVLALILVIVFAPITAANFAKDAAAGIKTFIENLDTE